MLCFSQKYRGQIPTWQGFRHILCASNHIVYYAALPSKGIIAYGIVELNPQADSEYERYTLAYFEVKKEFRRRSYGRQLFQHIIKAESIRSKEPVLYLTALNMHSGFFFYQLGCEYLEPQIYEDHILMGCTLRETKLLSFTGRLQELAENKERTTCPECEMLTIHCKEIGECIVRCANAD